MRRLDRRPRLGRAHRGNLADHLTGGRVLHLEGAARLGLHPFAADIVGLAEEARILEGKG